MDVQSGIIRVLLLCTILIGSVDTIATPITQTDSDATALILPDNFEQQSIALGDFFHFLKFPNTAQHANSAIEVADQLRRSSDWQKVNTENYQDFDNFENHIWLKASILNPSKFPQELLFVQNNARIGRFDVYLFANNELLEHITLGKNYPFNARIFNHRRFLIPIAIAAETELDIIISGTESGSLDLAKLSSLWQQSAFFQQSQFDDMWDMFYLGSVFALAFYNIFIFVISRERAYLFYSLFVCSTFTMFLHIEGWAFQYIWPNFPSINAKATDLSISLMVAFNSIFSKQFLNLKANTSNIYTWLKWIVYAVACLTVFLLLLPHDPTYTLVRIVGALAIPINLLALFAAIYISIKSKSNEAIIYTAAWSILIVALFLTLIHEMVIPIFSFSPYKFLQAAHLIEIILLSMALGTYITRLRIKENTMQAKSEAQSRFLARMSHEIRTPMNGIIGISDLLLKDHSMQKHMPMLETIHNSALSLEKIMNDILDYSKLEAGKLTIKQKHFDLRKLIDDIKELFVLECNQKAITLTVSISPDIPTTIYQDQLRLRQILTNLISNAVKFTEAGQIDIHVIIKQDNLLFTVSDTGKGINAEDQLRLFQPFEQASNNNLNTQASTGLGLSICRELIELMQGSIELESQINFGTRISFSLPYCRDNAAAKTPNFETKQATLANLQQLHILVVEDNSTNSFVIEQMLKKLHINAQYCQNGLDAVNTVEHTEDNFHVILMDCEMPIMDGFEATRAIRNIEQERQQKASHIIALTAHTLHEQLKACFDSGMDELLLKPLTLKKLEICLKNQLDVITGVSPTSPN